MNARLVLGALGSLFHAALLTLVPTLAADPVPVRHVEGRIQGFLVLRDVDDNILATGSSTQLVNGGRVSNDVSFHFKDGSLHQETTVFAQRGTFQLLTYRLVQKGPAFKRPLDMSLNASTGQVTIHYTDDGKAKTITDRMKLPADLANGMVPTLLTNIDPKTPKTTLSMLVATPKPRLVKLEISPQREDSFSIAGSPDKALRYVIKVEIGGVSGAIAPLVGKQPPDTHVWVYGGRAPGFLKLEGPLAEGGPVWRLELASPLWPKGRSEKPR